VQHRGVDDAPHRNRLCYDPVEVYLVLFNGALGYPFAVGEPGLIDPAWTPFNLSLGLTLSKRRC